MQVLYEGWLAANEDWESSSLVISIRSSAAHRKKGARKWFTRDELARKYSTGETLDYTIADEIIGEKVKDEVTAQQSCRPHPDCPNNESLTQYLCFDEATECDEQDEVMTSLMTCCDKDKKHKKKKDKKRKNSTSSSDSGSGSESGDSDSSDSSTESGKKKKKKDKKNKKNKSGKNKKGKKSNGKKGKKLTKAQKEKEQEKEKKKLKQEEEKQQEKVKTEKRSAAKKARTRPFEILVFQVPPSTRNMAMYFMLLKQNFECHLIGIL